MWEDNQQVRYWVLSGLLSLLLLSCAGPDNRQALKGNALGTNQCSTANTALMNACRADIEALIRSNFFHLSSNCQSAVIQNRLSGE